MNKFPTIIKASLFSVILFGAVAFGGLVLNGCVTKNTAPPTVTYTPGGFVTNPSPVAGEAPVVVQLPAVATTNPATPIYLVDSRINQWSNYAQQLASTASLVPAAAPVSNLASVAIAAIGAIIGGISGYVAQKKSTTAALAQASQNSDMLTAVIQGVESATKASTITAQSVKSAIQDTATAAGVQTQLHKVVLDNT